MIGQFGVGVKVWKFMAPYKGASVPRMPTRFRFGCATVHSERTTSYSTGMPLSRKGTMTFCKPEVMATPRKMLSVPRAPWTWVSTRRAVMPKRRSARTASSLKGSVSLIWTRTLAPPRAWISRSVPRRFNRVCT